MQLVGTEVCAHTHLSVGVECKCFNASFSSNVQMNGSVAVATVGVNKAYTEPLQEHDCAV